MARSWKFKKAPIYWKNSQGGKKVNPLKKINPHSWYKKTLSHRQQELLQEEAFAKHCPFVVVFPMTLACGFFQETKHQATNSEFNSIHFYILSSIPCERKDSYSHWHKNAAFPSSLLPEAGIWGFLNP